MAELVISIVSLAATILKTTRELIQISSNVRNGQDEWEHFCMVMARLSNELEKIKKATERNPAIQLEQNEHVQIEWLLKECKSFLDERPDSLAARIRWVLNPNNEAKLRGYREKMTEIFIHLINPFWSRAATHHALHHQAQPGPVPSQPERASTASVDIWRSLSWSSSTTASCYVAGAEFVEVKELPKEAIPASNFERLNIKVKLFLDKSLERVTELKFDEFYSTFDKDTAILDLQAPNRMVRLTQISSAGWIPITSKRSPLEAIIQSTTILDDNEAGTTKEIHQSRFSFDNPESRKRFQECLRGRKLLGEFKTKKITVNNSVRALSQLIQVWSGNWRSTATISYHDSITKKCQDLEYIEAKLPKKGREVVDLRSRFPKIDPAIQITFMKSAEAEAFMEIFNSHRLMAPSLPDPVPRPPSPTTTIGTSSAYSSRTSVSSFSKEWLSQFGNG
ncbi:hypothetical protein QBC37DRAFT_431840 [Rhypophila decipiens]|uniref:Uncharacterized protein n=1 Tax=Rhypophila decipiens TaxID=261697 RepID=A0AAN7B2I0_9PEZI|nr:hypothetical protein QBC37DRAFT_431840 [Rhypophila decipiens]